MGEPSRNFSRETQDEQQQESTASQEQAAETSSAPPPAQEQSSTQPPAHQRSKTSSAPPPDQAERTDSSGAPPPDQPQPTSTGTSDETQPTAASEGSQPSSADQSESSDSAAEAGFQQPLLRTVRALGARSFDLVAPVLGLAVLDGIARSAAADANADANADAEADASAQEDSVDQSDPESAGDNTGSPDDGRRTGTVESLSGDPVAMAVGEVMLLANDAGLSDPTDVVPVCTDCLVDTSRIEPDGPVLATIGALEDNAGDDLFALLDSTASELGYPADAAVPAMTSFARSLGLGSGGEASNLLSSIAAAPATILVEGDPIAAICGILEEAEDAIVAGGTAVNNVIDAVNLADPLNAGLVGQSAGLVGDVVDNLKSGPLLDAAVLDLDGGNGAGGELVDVRVTDLSLADALIQVDAAGDDAPSQSSNLIDVGIGPRNWHQGSIDVLNPVPGGNAGALEVNVLDVGADGPRLVDADLVTDEDVLNFAELPGAESQPLEAPIGDSALDAMPPAVDLPITGEVDELTMPGGLLPAMSAPTILLELNV